MECPKCKLVNPPNVTQCDCGYEFTAERTQGVGDNAVPNSSIGILLRNAPVAELKMMLAGLWVLLLLPSILLIPYSFMMFDPGDSLHARFCVLSLCTYPVAAIVALLLRNVKAWLVLLPFVNVVVFFLSGSYSK